MDPIYVDLLTTSINSAQVAVGSSAYPELPLWLGAASDAFNGGTPNVSDRFVSGFYWLELLGLAARRGISVVVRQNLALTNDSLLDVNLDPNPDYWLTLLHKQLVGPTVLDAGKFSYSIYYKSSPLLGK
jgi:heparanase 1